MTNKKEFLAISTALVRVFIGTILGQMIASGVGIFDLDGEAWKSYASAGITAVILVLYAYLNPKDPRFGKNKTTEIVDK